MLQFQPGTTVEQAASILEIDKWQAVKAQYFSPEGTPVPEAYYLRRSDNLKVLGNQTISSKYKESSNEKLLSWFSTLLENNPSMVLDSGMIINNGQQIILQARIDKELEVQDGDILHPYVVYILDHTGQSSDRILQLTKRLWCDNQLPAITKNKTYQSSLRIRHSSKSIEIVEKAKEVYSTLEQELDHNLALYRQWSNTAITYQQYKEFVNSVLNVKSAEVDKPVEWQRITQAFYYGDGNKGKTLWDFVNAVTQSLRDINHRTVESKVKAQLMGSSYNTAMRAAVVAKQALRMS